MSRKGLGVKMTMVHTALEKQMASFFAEDDLSRNLTYIKSLPHDLVETSLFIKSDLILSGLPWFSAAFSYLGHRELEQSFYDDFEGKKLLKGTVINMGKMPFSVALTGERIALNLLQRASSIATFTEKFVDKAKKYNVNILDTRKTTPGLRSLEKYAVRSGGGMNHRLGQSDMWMVKDNHKTFFGGVDEAVNFFKKIGGFYTPIELEVHNLDEYRKALDLGIKHIMLDNFSPENIIKCLDLKPDGVTIEASGGITMDNIDGYLIEGLDAISLGCLTYGAPPVDVSFKYKR